MPNYENGIVYKLVDTRDESDAYVGSTVLPMRKRYSKHLCDARRGLGTAFYKLLRALPPGTFEPRLIERCPCTCSAELRKREQFWIDSLAPPYNVNRAFSALTAREQVRASWAKYRTKYNARKREKIRCAHCPAVVSRNHMCCHMRSARCFANRKGTSNLSSSM